MGEGWGRGGWGALQYAAPPCRAPLCFLLLGPPVAGLAASAGLEDNTAFVDADSRITSCDILANEEVRLLIEKSKCSIHSTVCDSTAC